MTKRKERLEEQIRQEVGLLLVAGEVKDPRLTGFITVMRATLNHDLTVAKVYISVYGTDKEMATTMAGLRSSEGYVTGVVGRRMTIKNFPQIRFVQDHSLAYVQKIDDLLDTIHHEEQANGHDRNEG